MCVYIHIHVSKYMCVHADVRPQNTLYLFICERMSGENVDVCVYIYTCVYVYVCTCRCSKSECPVYMYICLNIT